MHCDHPVKCKSPSFPCRVRSCGNLLEFGYFKPEQGKHLMPLSHAGIFHLPVCRLVCQKHFPDGARPAALLAHLLRHTAAGFRLQAQQ